MIVRPRPDIGRYELLEDLVYPGGVVLKGFAFDGASIPRAAWTVLGYTPFHPRLMRGACVHDDLYHRRVGSRREADELFERMIVADGVSISHAQLMYAAVRQFGSLTWMDADDAAERDRREQSSRESIEQGA